MIYGTRVSFTVIALLISSSVFAISSSNDAQFSIRLVHPDNALILKSRVPNSALDGYEKITLNQSGRINEFWINKRIELNLHDVKHACPAIEMSSQYYSRIKDRCPPMSSDLGDGPHLLPTVYVVLTEEGAFKFKELTHDHVKELVSVFLDREPIQVAVIHEPMTSGVLTIYGHFTRADVLRVAERINDLKANVSRKR